MPANSAGREWVKRKRVPIRVPQPETGKIGQASRLIIQTLERLYPLVASELCLLYGIFQHADGFIIDLDRHWVRVTILTAQDTEWLLLD